jgi:phosphomannomutase
VRPSGTEPLLRVMVEADDEGLASGWVDALVESMPAV